MILSIIDTIMDQNRNATTCSAGIHTRNYARSFIVEDVETETRVVFVSCDTAMMGQLVKVEQALLLRSE